MYCRSSSSVIQLINEAPPCTASEPTLKQDKSKYDSSDTPSIASGISSSFLPSTTNPMSKMHLGSRSIRIESPVLAKKLEGHTGDCMVV